MPRSNGFVSPQLLFGLCLVIVGVLLTLDNLDVVETRAILRYWPVALIVIGGFMILEGAPANSQSALSKRDRLRRSTSRTTGWVLLIVGSWILLAKLKVLPFSIWELFWPMIFMLLGGGLIWQTVNRQRRRDDIAADQDTSLTGILSGTKRKWDVSPFRHADITAFWGGTELDLRKATLRRGEEAVVDVFALMAGHEIQVPEGWNVVCEVHPLMGGVEDKTDVPDDPDAPRLLVRGFVMMGGLEIKH